MRERSFVQRNKAVRLRELTDVVALRAEGDAARRRTKGSRLDSFAPDVPASQVSAFEAAGWVFRERAEDEPSEATPRAKVFVKPDGRLALGTNMLTVQLRGDPSEDQANTLLRPYGGRVVERLTFAPGLFRVAVTDEARGDSVDVANQLADSGLVEFAEPELIEATGPRSA